MRNGSFNTVRKAYDKILQMAVTAQEAAMNEGYERNRYVCVVCEEEVYVAAANSTERSVHFRHRRGNNNVECEYYLGQLTGKFDSSSFRRRSRDIGEIYFDNVSRTFCLGLKFSEDEIEDWGQKNILVKLETEDKGTTLLEINIDRLNFSPDSVSFFPLTKYSSSYYLSFSSEKEKGRRLLFTRKNTPIFFRLMGSEYENKFKYVRRGTLYTNTKYLAVIPLKKANLKSYLFVDEFDIEETFEIKTMGKDFLCVILVIKNTSKYLASLLNSWNYNVETSETLTILWPPTYLKDNKCYMMSDNIFIYSSFRLNSRVNINVPSEDIHHVSSTVSKINLLPQTIIFRKNAELVIEKKSPKVCYQKHFQSYSIKSNVFTVPEDGLSYFIFNCYGVSQLSPNQKVYLTPESLIVGYKQNYPVAYITHKGQKIKSGSELLDDILAHYKRTENFDRSMFDQYTLTTHAGQYAKKCEINGEINAVVKHYIEEGRL